MNPHQQFILSLRLGNQIIKLKIGVEDSKDEVFEKLLLVHPNCSNKKQQVLAKIVATLQHVINEQDIPQSLYRRIVHFLTGAFPYITSRNDSHHKQISRQRTQILPISQVSSVLQQKRARTHINTQNSVQNKKKTQILQSASKQKKAIKTPVKACQMKATNIKKKNSNRNPDLIKACQNILKKSHQNDMKVMARQFLKQKGCLPQSQQVKINKKSSKKLDSLPEESKSMSPLAKMCVLQSKEIKKNPLQSKCLNISEISIEKNSSGYKRTKYNYLNNYSNESLNMDFIYKNYQQNSPVRTKKFSYLDD